MDSFANLSPAWELEQKSGRLTFFDVFTVASFGISMSGGRSANSVVFKSLFSSEAVDRFADEGVEKERSDDSRSDNQEFADLDKLARRFLETNPDSSTQKAPTPAYVEEVVEGIRNGENTECPICLESADDPVLTPCAHRMCRECLLSSWRTPACGLCPICRQMLKKHELFTCPSANRFRVDVEKNWQVSSKVSKLMDCLEPIRKSGEKSIVFSQWTSFLDLLEIPLKRKQIGYLRFDGKLSQKQRERVLKEFSETNEKTILLISLRAGGVGLNLTAASNVFLMYPWWNPAVEEQAIMRIHRIGQKKTVRVRRFIVKFNK